MDNLSLIGFTVSIGINMFLLFNRKKSWNTLRFRVIVSLAIVSIAVISIIFVNAEESNIYTFVWYLNSIIICNILDRICKMISEKIHGRDFYLWLRGSSEIDDSFGAKNEHVLISDKLFSLLFLILIFGLPLVSIMMKI